MMLALIVGMGFHGLLMPAAAIFPNTPLLPDTASALRAVSTKGNNALPSLDDRVYLLPDEAPTLIQKIRSRINTLGKIAKYALGAIKKSQLLVNNIAQNAGVHVENDFDQEKRLERSDPDFMRGPALTADSFGRKKKHLYKAGRMTNSLVF